jgi:uncharacterized membrane protein
MDQTPRAERFRLVAMASYLPFIALIWLAQKQFMDVRLIRFHTYQAIALWIWFVAILIIGSVCSALFGGVPEIGFWINVLVGVLFLIALPGLFAMGGYASVMAFMGNTTQLPVLSEWAWLRVEGKAKPRPVGRKKRKRKAISSGPQE